MKILIVEDEPKTGEYLRQGLTEAGYVADLVPHGTDGLHMALQGAYDLVILDVMLPTQSGLEVLAALRADPVLAATPVLMLTARGTAGRGAITPEGADRVMAKPFDNDELRRIVSEMLGPRG